MLSIVIDDGIIISSSSRKRNVPVPLTEKFLYVDQSVLSKSIYGVMTLRSLDSNNTLTVTYGIPDNLIALPLTTTLKRGWVVSFEYESTFLFQYDKLIGNLISIVPS